MFLLAARGYVSRATLKALSRHSRLRRSGGANVYPMPGRNQLAQAYAPCAWTTGWVSTKR